MGTVLTPIHSVLPRSLTLGPCSATPHHVLGVHTVQASITQPSSCTPSLLGRGVAGTHLTRPPSVQH